MQHDASGPQMWSRHMGTARTVLVGLSTIMTLQVQSLKFQKDIKLGLGTFLVGVRWQKSLMICICWSQSVAEPAYHQRSWNSQKWRQMFKCSSSLKPLSLQWNILCTKWLSCRVLDVLATMRMPLRLMAAWAAPCYGTRYQFSHTKWLKTLWNDLQMTFMTRADAYVFSQSAHSCVCPLDAFMCIHTFSQGLRRSNRIWQHLAHQQSHVNVKGTCVEGSDGPGHLRYSWLHACMLWHVTCWPTFRLIFVHIVLVGLVHLH